MQLRFHQVRTIDGINEARTRGVRRLCVQGPTGSGKTVAFLALARQEVENGGSVVVYTDRKTIRSQISSVFESQDLYHGIRAAGYKPSLCANVQVSSVMTERSRCLSADPIWELHRATLVIVDEAHRNRAKTARTILDRHHDQGAFITGWTATPVGLKGVYEELFAMTSLQEMRDAGYLVFCDVYAPEEVDMSGVRMVSGEFHQGLARQRVRESLVIGRVVEHYDKLNPEHRPTVLFAPGVPESRWLTEQLAWHGISAAHIDAKTPDTKRQKIFAAWRDRDIEIVSNFGVLQEGFDFQQCAHAILARPTAKVSTYLQMVGRILRAAPGKDRAVLQDHTGSFWRHGSPNDDRVWGLSDTDQSISRKRKKKPTRDGPSLCPQCGAVRYSIPGYYGYCPKCGYQGEHLKRIVRQTDGKLVKVRSKPAGESKRDNLLREWRSCIFVAARSGMTAGQAVIMLKRKTDQWISQRVSPWPVPEFKSTNWRLPASQFWPEAAIRKD